MRRVGYFQEYVNLIYVFPLKLLSMSRQIKRNTHDEKYTDISFPCQLTHLLTHTQNFSFAPAQLFCVFNNYIEE